MCKSKNSVTKKILLNCVQATGTIIKLTKNGERKKTKEILLYKPLGL